MLVAPTKTKSNLETSILITPAVYSYIRWSKLEQALGDSERRQVEMTRAFAKTVDLPFDETLQMTDRGLSGYHGVNRKRGALGRFLTMVENRKVAVGSILVVENIDRLSREGIGTALRKIIFKLWDYGIILQTLEPMERYEPECESEPKFIVLILSLDRAHKDSERKAECIIEIREEDRKSALKSGKKINGQSPLWVVAIKDDNQDTVDFKVIPEAVESIKLMFDLRLNGLGKLAIAQKLNEIAEWSPPPKMDRNKQKRKVGGWGVSYVQSTLQNRAVIGEHQLYKFDEEGKRVKVGKPISGYFPQIIDNNTFYAVQESFKANRGKGGRHGKVKNLFTHITHCGYCKNSQYLANGGSKKHNADYLICKTHMLHHGCSRNSIRYDELENTILDNCRELKPEQVLPNPDEQNKLCQSLRRRIQGDTAELRDIEKQINNLMINLHHTKNPKMVERYEQDIARLDEWAAKIETQKAEDEKELVKTESSLQSFTKWKRDLVSLRKAIKKDGSAELRMRLRMRIAELIENIEIFGHGIKENECRVKFGRIGTLFDDKKTRPVREKELTEFAEYIAHRITNSKRGRFIRIHFKSGSIVEFWPDGSIPYNLTFWTGKDGNIDWDYKGNNFRWLWDDFKAVS